MSNIIQLNAFRRQAGLARLDGFQNLTTGYGTGLDHGEGFLYSRDVRLSPQTLADLYAENALAQRIVDTLPDEAMTGLEISSPDEDAIHKALKAIQDSEGLPNGFETAKLEAEKTARAIDGSAIFLSLDDGKDPAEPVGQGPQTILACDVIERDYITPYGGQLGRSLRQELWQISGQDNRPLMVIHASRLMFCHGRKTTRDRMLENGGWGESVLRPCWRPLMAYALSHGMVPNILKSYIRDVLKIGGLTELAEMDDQSAAARAFWDRMKYMFDAESLLRMTVIDKDTDELERHTTTVTGLNDLIRNPEKWLMAASNMPHTKLFCESPGNALSQSGSSQEKDWQKTKATYQKHHLRPHYQRLFYLITGNWETQFSFCPGDEPSQKEQSETFKNMADGVVKLVEAQVITPSEGASVFEGEKLRATPKLNLEAREGLEDMDSELLAHGMTVPETPEETPHGQVESGTQSGTQSKDPTPSSEAGSQLGDAEQPGD